MGLRNFISLQPQAFQMQFNSLAHIAFDFLLCFSGRHAAI